MILKEAVHASSSFNGAPQKYIESIFYSVVYFEL